MATLIVVTLRISFLWHPNIFKSMVWLEGPTNRTLLEWKDGALWKFELNKKNSCFSDAGYSLPTHPPVHRVPTFTLPLGSFRLRRCLDSPNIYLKHQTYSQFRYLPWRQSIWNIWNSHLRSRTQGGSCFSIRATKPQPYLLLRRRSGSVPVCWLSMSAKLKSGEGEREAPLSP